MKKTLPTKIILSILLAVITTLVTLNNFAQTPIGLFASPGTGGPTGNGNSAASQTVTFYRNSTTPASNPLSATFAITNQQFSSIEGNPGVPGTTFGGSANSGLSSAYNIVRSHPIYNTIANFAADNVVGGPINNSDFTLCNTCTPSSGFNVNNTYGVEMINWTDALINSWGGSSFPLNSSRIWFADLEITFNRPVNNPVVQFVQLGSFRGWGILTPSGSPIWHDQGFSTDFQLVSASSIPSSISLSRLSGNSYFSVSANTVFHNGSVYGNGSTLHGIFRPSANGSVTIVGNNVQKVVLRMLMKGDGGMIINANGNPQSPYGSNRPMWALPANFSPTPPPGYVMTSTMSSVGGEAMMIGLSAQDCAAGSAQVPLTSGTVSNICPATTANLNSLLSGTAPVGSSLLWFTNNSHTGTAYATPTAAIAGTYYAFFFDATNNCFNTDGSTAQAIVSINIPTAPLASLATQPTCAVGGSAKLSGLPAIGAWTINISPAVAGATGVTGSGTTATIGNLPLNTYTFNVTNSGGCKSPASTSVTFTKPSIPVAPTANAFTQPTCTVNGSVVLSGLPSGSFLINISPAVPGATGTSGSGGSTTIGNLPANTYNFTVTNTATSCTSAALSGVVLIKCCAGINQVTLTSSTLANTCPDSTADLTTIAGLAPTGSNLVWFTNNTHTGTKYASPTKATAGLYFAFFVDATNNCYNSGSSTAQVIVSINITNAPSASLEIQPNCSVGGSVKLSGLPASGAWTINITPSVTNATGLTGSGTTATVGNLPAGTYTFSVTNSSGCISSSTAAISLIQCCAGINQVTLTSGTLANTCPSSTANLNSLTGLAPTGSNLVWFTNNTHTGTAYASPTAAIAGTYYAFFFDATNNCFNTSNSTASVVVTIHDCCPTVAPMLIDTTGLLCMPAFYGGFVNLNSFVTSTAPSGSVLIWKFGGVTVANPTAVTAAGIYTATYFNSILNCSSPSVNYTVTLPPAATPTTKNIYLCLPTTTVDITNFVPPAPAGYRIEWWRTNRTGQLIDITAAPADSYRPWYVSIDSYCYSFPLDTLVITQLAAPATPVTGVVVKPNCVNLKGSIALSGLPATGAWSINIIPAVAGATGVTGSGTTTTISNLPAGSYTFTVTSATGCTSAPTSAVPVIKTCVVQPPVAQNIRNAPMNNSVGQTNIGGFVASDPQGDSITSYTVTTLPPANTGILYTCTTNSVPCTGSYTAVTANQVLTPAQAASLYFDPVNTFMGASTFGYTATSKNGTSNVATETIPVFNNPPTANSFTTKAFAQNSTNNPLPPLTGADADGTVISYTVMPPLPAQGTITYCITPPSSGCGTLINITTVLTPAQISTLRFTPATGVIGIVPFTYTTTDNNGNVSTIATVTIPVTPSGLPLGNLPPLTQNVTIAPLNSNHGSTLISPLIGTDPDGTIAIYIINTIPSAATGVLYYCTTGKYPCTGILTAVTPNQILTPAQAATLQFDPAAGNNTPASFTYSAKDNIGLLSNVSWYTIPVINNPPTAVTIQTLVPFNSINAFVPALQGNDADGTLLSFKVTTVPNAATEGTLFYCSNGTVPCTGTQTAITANTILTPAQAITVNFTPITGYVGTAKGTYTTTDNNGNESQPAEIILKVEDFKAVGLPPVAKGISISMSANAPTTALSNTFITGNDPDGTIDTYTITSLPPSSQGVYTYCTAPPSSGCGTPLILGMLTPIQAASLSFKPNARYTGPAMLGFTVTDNSGNMSNIANSAVNVNSIAPIATGYTTAPVKNGGASKLTPLLANDLLDNGTIVSYTITSIPTTGNGTLTYCLTPPLIGCGTAITVGTFLTPAQAATVRYTPGSNMTVYEVPFNFTATDNSGNLSNVATIVLPVDKGLPDFSSTIEINRVSFARVGVSRDMVIKVAEQIDNPSLGQVVVMISKVLGFDITFSPTTTLSNVYRGLVVNNKDWLITENSTFIICTLKSGLIIPRYGISSIGLNVTRKINIAKNSTQNISVIIINDSGGDTDKSNNVYNMGITAQ